MRPLLLQAFEGKNTKVPVWFMRQAGRYLPQYQALKGKYKLSEMFNTPELAAKITCLPIDILKVDAAILFADILTLPSAMGFKIEFENGLGPVIANPIKKVQDIDNIHDFADLGHVAETIRLTNQQLPAEVPLIGFAGSPFTVLCYLIEGGSSVGFAKTFHLMHQEPAAFKRAMTILSRNTVEYLKLQKAAGIQAFQLFDTWGGILRPADYAHFVLPYIQQIFESVDLPSIYYLRNCAHLLPLMHQCKSDFLSVCHTVVLGHNPILEKNDQGVQGNLFNGLLYADKKILEQEVNDVLVGARTHYRRYIFNLSHGVFPDVDADQLKFIVEKVHQFKWKD